MQYPDVCLPATAPDVRCRRPLQRPGPSFHYPLALNFKHPLRPIGDAHGDIRANLHGDSFEGAILCEESFHHVSKRKIRAPGRDRRSYLTPLTNAREPIALFLSHYELRIQPMEIPTPFLG